MLRTEHDQQTVLRSVITMIDSQAFLPFSLTRQAPVAAALEGHESALALLDRAEVVATETGSQFYLSETWRTRAAILRSIEPSLSRHALDEALRISHEQGAVVFERRARADLEAQSGDLPNA